MARAKKFGTFGGVFTPSILTILGVIMYLRFPWIIGQAGLLMTIGIIITAHIISITTGLSVASIATDKKVKTGGTYYMISRSLGLPIGGTLGLALFVGLSFSVSLYLIGFAESFLNWFNFEITKNSIRIAGTIILIFVTTVTFISTSLAIKSQYFIMAAIALSLLSIFFGNHEFTPSEPIMKPVVDVAPFMILFGIFFPAVTGFEAGVSMSGDLKDPKKSLPIGAMAAVGVGFVSYIGLALFFTYTVDNEALINDPNILFKISLVPELVIAGIWGATLSSALGSILGAPRILQATAVDKIVPKFFAKGYGKSNEPRNALLLTFIIAEIGILIGELDVIARIVSMFFITTYAFLNLASFIESWASSDFRPDFKIPRFVSLLGATASIIVMILLDFIALIAAVLVLGILFFYLKRRQLLLDGGDAWNSFAATLVKNNIIKLSRNKTVIRNWRPNILMFSTEKTDYNNFENLAKTFTGKLGMLTNIKLHEKPEASYKIQQIHKEQLQTQATKDTHKHAVNIASYDIFIKEFYCKNIFESIENISGIYGFSGIEPNTVLLDFNMMVKSNEKFLNILKNNKRENLNTIVFKDNYKKTVGSFGTVDFWWQGKGKYIAFSLSLLRFILQNPNRRDAKLRILTINENNSASSKLYGNIIQIIDKYRIHATVKIIDNYIKKQDNFDIILTESFKTDLTIIGIPERVFSNTQDDASFLRESIIKLKSESSLLFLYPNDSFENIDTELNVRPKKTKTELQEYKASMPLIKNELIKDQLSSVYDKFFNIYKKFIIENFEDSYTLQKDLINSYKTLIIKVFTELIKSKKNDSNYKKKLSASKSYGSFLFQIKKLSEKTNEKYLVPERKTLSEGINTINLASKVFIEKIPDIFIININNKKHKIPVNNLINFYFNYKLGQKFSDFLKEYNILTYEIFAEIQKTFLYADKIIYSQIKSKNIDYDVFVNGRNEINKNFVRIFNKFTAFVSKQILNNLGLAVNETAKELENPISFRKLKQKYKIKQNEKIFLSEIIEIPEERYNTEKLINNSNYIELYSLYIKNRLRKYRYKTNEILDESIRQKFISITSRLKKYLNENKKSGLQSDFPNKKLHLGEIFTIQFADFRQFLSTVPEHIEAAGSSSDYGFNIETQTVEYRKILTYRIETVFYENVFRELNTLDREITFAIEKLQDTARLFNFNFENSDNETILETSQDEQNNLINKTLNKIINIENDIIKKIENFQKKQEIYSEKTYEQLNSYAIIHTAKETSTAISKRKRNRVFKRILEYKEKMFSYLVDLPVEMIYRKSNGILLAEKLTSEDRKINIVQKISQTVEQTLPNETEIEKIPLSYQNLFNSKFSISEDLIITRKSEIRQAKKAVAEFNSGQYSGGIMIIGEKQSGKTVLGRQIASMFFNGEYFVKIRPPREGSLNLKIFKNELKKAFGTNNKISSILQNLPHSQFIFIDDLELWWKRTNNGFRIVDYIIKLIYKYGNRHLFVLACNTHTYNFINKYKRFDHCFNSVIECEPFDAEMIKNAIIKRHRAGGLKFKLNKKHEDNISRLRLAAFFDSIFNYSSGNIGTAINAKNTFIEKFKNNIIYIKQPVIPSLISIDLLDDDKINLLIQFILHKNLTKEKTISIMQLDREKIEVMIDTLMRTKIVSKENKIYCINKHFEPFIIKVLMRKKLL